jgi:hypothetical protein
MADFDDVNLDTSSNEGDFEGFTPEDVIKAIEKGVQLKSSGSRVLLSTNQKNSDKI